MKKCHFPQMHGMVRFLCLALVMLMLVTAVASCSDEKTPPVDTGTDHQGTEQNTGDGYDPEAAPTPYLEDFGGYEFRVLTRGSGMWTSDDISGDYMGSIIAQAAYNRNEYLGERYNFSVYEYKADDWVTTARNTALAGGDEAYDMWSFKMNDMPSLAQEGLVYDLNTVSCMNIDAAYYDQSLRYQGTFANHLFFLTGDLLYQDDLATECVAFNATMFDELNLESAYSMDMYELVDAGKWTLATYTELARMTTVDKNGDGAMDNTDYWGFCYEPADILTLNIAAGNSLLQKDADDIFVLNSTEKQINDLQKIMGFLNSGYAVAGNWEDSVFTRNVQFTEICAVMDLATFDGEGLNFGVVPMPKIDEEQKNYNSFISTYGSNCITICTTVQGEELNKVANIIDLLSYESRQSVSPQLNKYIFGAYVLQHAEDVRMLEVVFANRRYELCYLWSTGGLYSSMISVCEAKGEGLAGVFDSSKGAVEASVARKLERLQNLA
ncbi:MAG: hypothetical protein J6B71_00675 [Clostridia bacterium]|nr:hypothetical protein [Clostridia bacterium]